MIAALFLAAAAAAPLSCPLTLPREAVTVHAPPGWRGYTPSLMRLTGFGLLAGPPETMSYLVPRASRKGRTTWQVGAGPRWLYCTYDHGAAVQIARPLPAGALCTIAYRETRTEGITAMMASCHD